MPRLKKNKCTCVAINATLNGEEVQFVPLFEECKWCYKHNKY